MEKNPSQFTTTSTRSSENAYMLRLFVAGASPNSVRAINNLKEICDLYLAGKYSLEIIDVYQQPAIAKIEQIIALPLLIKQFPEPRRRLIGDLSDRNKVLKALSISG